MEWQQEREQVSLTLAAVTPAPGGHAVTPCSPETSRDVMVTSSVERMSSAPRG